MSDQLDVEEAGGDDSLDTAALEARLLRLSASGQDIPSERQLVVEWQVPRSRLRRALARLRETGVLPPAQVGRRASNDTAARVEDLARVANPADVIELRIMFEPQLARLAAIRGSANDIAQITRAAATRPDTEYGAADLAFHREVARASRNDLAKEMYELLRQVGTDSRVQLSQQAPTCPKRRAIRDAEHMAVAQAIAARDPERAAHAMLLHLTEVQRLIHNRLAPSATVLRDGDASSNAPISDDSSDAEHLLSEVKAKMGQP